MGQRLVEGCTERGVKRCIGNDLEGVTICAIIGAGYNSINGNGISKADRVSERLYGDRGLSDGGACYEPQSGYKDKKEPLCGKTGQIGQPMLNQCE